MSTPRRGCLVVALFCMVLWCTPSWSADDTQDPATEEDGNVTYFARKGAHCAAFLLDEEKYIVCAARGTKLSEDSPHASVFEGYYWKLIFAAERGEIELPGKIWFQMIPMKSGNIYVVFSYDPEGEALWRWGRGATFEEAMAHFVQWVLKKAVS